MLQADAGHLVRTARTGNRSGRSAARRTACTPAAPARGARRSARAWPPGTSASSATTFSRTGTFAPGSQVDLLEVPAGVQRRIDQRVEIHRLVAARTSPLRALRVPARCGLPAGRQLHARRDRDLVGARSPAGYSATVFHCRLSIAGVITTRPCAGRSATGTGTPRRCVATPAGTSSLNAYTSSGSRVHAMRWPLRCRHA